MIRFTTNGTENGKTAYLAAHRLAGRYVTFASIVFSGSEWVLRRLESGRIDRFDKLCDAKDEARKG